MSQELILDFRALVLGGSYRSCMLEAITSGVVLRNRERLKKEIFLLWFTASYGNILLSHHEQNFAVSFYNGSVLLSFL